MHDSWRVKLSQFNARTWYRAFSQRSVRIVVINEPQQTLPSAKQYTVKSLSIWYLRTRWFVSEISLVRWTHSFYFRYYYLVLKYQTGRLPLKYPINQKGTKPRDTITQFVDLCADSKIRKAAMATGDSRIIGLSSRDLVAAEAWYHGQGFMTSRYCDYCKALWYTLLLGYSLWRKKEGSK